jgi:threonine aldolase
VSRLAEDHEHARRLGEALAEAGLPVDLDQVETNFVLLDVGRRGLPADEAVARLRAEGVLLSFGTRKDVLRAVTHLDVSAAHIEQAIERIPRALASTDRPVELAGEAPTPY